VWLRLHQDRQTTQPLAQPITNILDHHIDLELTAKDRVASRNPGQDQLIRSLIKGGTAFFAGLWSRHSEGRTIWIADAHRDDGKRFVVHADEKLTAFLELESQLKRTGGWA
jgi:hypothetical protein